MENLNPYRIEGYPDLFFVSCNNNMVLMRTKDTEVKDGYLYNCYSRHDFFGQGKIKAHKKLKIYKAEIGGYYVIAQDHRCYMNSLVGNL